MSVSFPFLSTRSFSISLAFLFSFVYRFFVVSFTNISFQFPQFSRVFSVYFLFLFIFLHFHPVSLPFSLRFFTVSLPFPPPFLFHFQQQQRNGEELPTVCFVTLSIYIFLNPFFCRCSTPLLRGWWRVAGGMLLYARFPRQL